MNARDFFTGNTVSSDLFNLIVGKRLGSGIGREVFTLKSDPSLVLKFETNSQSFQNVNEWEVWKDAQHDDRLKIWLAPCVDISSCGTILVQKRTMPVPKEKMPLLIPKWACDEKIENWGRLGRKIVMHDYGVHNLLTHGAGGKLVKADWWSTETEGYK